MLLTKKNLAELFQCSTRKIELMQAEGALPKALRLGDNSPRWRPEDIDAWLEEKAAAAQLADQVAT